MQATIRIAADIRTWGRLYNTIPVEGADQGVYSSDGVLRSTSYQRHSCFSDAPVSCFEGYQARCVMTSKFRSDDLACKQKTAGESGRGDG